MKCIMGNVEVAYSARHHLINERGTGAEMCPAGIWDLGSLLETRRSAIGQFSSLALVTVPEVFAKKQLGPVSLSSVEQRVRTSSFSACQCRTCDVILETYFFTFVSVTCICAHNL